MEIGCYLDMDDTDFQNTPRMLTICVNSIWRLSKAKYDVVILDECGLIRRHFLSSTCTEMLEPIWTRFVQLVNEADFVVMLQDGVSRDDAQFYTEICNVACDDRTRVTAMSFRKPVRIHPLKRPTKWEAAGANMTKCDIDPIKDGHCQQPLMVFCSSVKFAEFLVEHLRKVASTMVPHHGDQPQADPARVKGVWGSIRDTDPFCQAFAEDPNLAATQADVVVCTSVVGAGFSIESHFVAFHAFLFTGILSHGEEEQFIQRLRFIMKYLPRNAHRQSYLYLEKGRGAAVDYARVLSDFNEARLMLLKTSHAGNTASVYVLEVAQARIATEASETRCRHVDMWVKDWSPTIQSTFEPLHPD